MNGIKPEYQDRDLSCADCGEMFTWEKGEQAFYEQKGFPPPKRCKLCRQELKRKQRADEQREAQNGHQ